MIEIIKKNFNSDSLKNCLNFPLNKNRCNMKLVPPNSIKTTVVILIAIPFIGNPVIELGTASFIISEIPPSLVENPPVDTTEIE